MTDSSKIVDLSKIVAGTNEVQLVIPGVGEVGFYVTLRHESSDEVTKVTKQYEKRLMDVAKRGRNGDRTTLLEWYRRELLSAHVAGWRWTNPEFTFGGEQPEYSPETAKQLLFGDNAFSYYFKKLVESEVLDDESFLVTPA